LNPNIEYNTIRHHLVTLPFISYQSTKSWLQYFVKAVQTPVTAVASFYLYRASYVETVAVL